MDLIVGLLSTLGIGGLLLWILQRQSSLLKSVTRLEVLMSVVRGDVQKLDGFRETLALTDAKANAAHKRIDEFQ